MRSVAIESKALQTDAWHHRSDAMTSLAAAVGIFSRIDRRTLLGASG
jgi:divalent metal cation (Fe/Co/Zn/Cd) transporter